MTTLQGYASGIWAGSGPLAVRIGRVLVPEGRFIATVLRLGGTVYLSPHMLEAARTTPVLLVGGTCAWCVAAYQASRGKNRPADAKQLADVPAGAGDEAAFLTLLHQLMPGPDDRAHIAQIAAAWTGNETTTAPVRELCTTLGIEITKGVRIKGRTPPVSTGIHHRHLPPLPNPSPTGPVAVVAAGQHGQHGGQQQQQQDADNSAFTSVPDPDEPYRTNIHWPDQAARQAS